MAKHQKHTKLTFRENGNFAPNEISFVGTKCSAISNVTQQISENLDPYKLAYFDASHNKDTQKNPLMPKNTTTNK